MEQEGVMKMVICEKANTCKHKENYGHCVPHNGEELRKLWNEPLSCTKGSVCGITMKKVKCVEVEP